MSNTIEGAEIETRSDALTRITRLSNLLVTQTNAIDAAEEALKVLKADKLRTEREDLPDLMREFGLSELKLADGSKVTASDDVTCGIPEAMRERAWAWLKEKGYDGIIKTDVVRTFGRGEESEAAALAEEIGAECRRNVHSATLKAFVKERMAAGEAVPFDVFGVFAFAVAKVKLPKG